MSRIQIAPIVEGDGEVAAIRILLQRIWTELLGGEHADVKRPILRKRDRLIREQFNELSDGIEFAVRMLAEEGSDPGLILVLVDAEDDMACELGPELLKRARNCRPDADVACVIANRCYETWFVAAASSLSKYLDLTNDPVLPENPELTAQRKDWIAQRIRGVKYSEPVDMPRLTAAMDLKLCRSRSPSFDKLCRELEARLTK